MNQIAAIPKRSLVDSMAAKYEMEPAAFISAIKATVIKGDCSHEQFAAFLMVAKEYDLNPLTKEIYAFPDRGGITPIVSIDGWMNLINSHPQFDGMEFTDVSDESGKLFSVECRMYRKDRNRPTSVIEYMSECFRPTDPWKKWPNRMLRHKSAIQCARYAFGFSGIMEPDEYERMKDVTPSDKPSVIDRLQAARAAPEQPAGEREGFSAEHVNRETANVLTGEIIDNSDHGDGIPSSTPEAGEDASSTAPEPGEDPPQTPSSGSEPIPEQELMVLRRFAKDVLNKAADTTIEIATLRSIEQRWAGDITKLSPLGQQGAKSISTSMRAVVNDPAMLEGVLDHYAEVLECPVAELEASR